MSTIKTIKSDKAPAIFGPFSHAVMTDDFLFPSGQMGIDPDSGDLVKGGVREETKQIFKNLQAILSEADLTFDNIIKATVYITDMDSFNDMNEVYASHFSGNYPSRACIGISSLAKGAKVEIDFICLK